MRQRVEDGDTRFPVLARQMSAEKRWTWFVSLAVERFERWCGPGAITSTNIQSYRLPPVDVVMVWHAYLLNPGWYIEDTMRISQLTALAAFNPYMDMVRKYVEILVPDDPVVERTSYWETSTWTLYDPFDSTRNLTHKYIVCPGCFKQVAAPFLNESGSGYAQMNFRFDCPCGHSITKDTLGVYKFAKNLLEPSESDTGKYFAYCAFPCSLHHPGNVFDIPRAIAIRRNISDVAQFKNKVTDEIMVKVKNNHDLRLHLATKLKSRLSNRIAAAYTDDRMFSIDLVGAVLRQASFIKKMADLGWTAPTFFSSEAHSLLLVNSIVKYHAFLGLMQSSPSGFFVPTLDIDLVWHTHQLTAQKYQSDCRRLVTRCIDHNDKVDDGKLSDAFDSTCRAWKARYGVPYAQCGCPVPDNTILQRLRHIVSATTLRKNAQLKPEVDLDASAATHPSDHNAVHVNGPGASAHKSGMKSNNSTHEKAFHPGAGASASNTGGCVSDSHNIIDKSDGANCAVVCNIVESMMRIQ
ncbi:hypothetical protein M405DRAFT_724080 [Rhizopogon salebrosus TDB-379]|nr:hypothetical protein M405DRAFT_724080 [Rhizopogon salebrosus TDB-379]